MTKTYMDAEPWEGLFPSTPRLHALSVEDVLAFRPCPDYPEPRVRALARAVGRERATLLDVVPVLLGAGVPAQDVQWLAHHTAWFEEPDFVLRWLAADYAGAVLHQFEERYPTDTRPRRAIEAARRRACGLTDDAATAAYAAAAAVAYAAAADYAAAYAAAAVAYAAAYAAASEAAAAYAAASEAAAAYEAAAAAYDPAAAAAQVERLLFVLRGGKNA